jgi:hypothetical protein
MGCFVLSPSLGFTRVLFWTPGCLTDKSGEFGDYDIPGLQAAVFLTFAMTVLEPDWACASSEKSRKVSSIRRRDIFTRSGMLLES